MLQWKPIFLSNMVCISDIRTEPQIRVGVILPEDNLTSADLSIKINDKEASLHLDVQNDLLKIGSETFETYSTSVPSSNILLNHITMENMVAGRGFHWQKSVPMSFPGSLHFSVINGSILAVNELPLEQYLMCVATSEMGTACPEALIQAQTIVARSFILANAEKKHDTLGFDFCNDDCCQRYHGIDGLSKQSMAGSESTRGLVCDYKGIVGDTRYSKSCGGMMESFGAVWNEPNPNYYEVKPDQFDHLEPVDLSKESEFYHWIESPPYSFCSPDFIPENNLSQYLGGVDESGKYFRWQFTYTQNDLVSMINDASKSNYMNILALKVLKRGGSGRIIKMEIHGIDSDGKPLILPLSSEYEIRRQLHPGFLFSSAFTIHYNSHTEKIPDSITLKGAGWGHGAGLCQIGALGMALAGLSAKDIVLHYYPNTSLTKCYQ